MLNIQPTIYKSKITPIADEEYENEEVEARIDEAEADFKAGRFYTSEQMDERFEALKVRILGKSN